MKNSNEIEDYKLEILYQDEYLVAINKPSGLLVHKSILDKHEIHFAMKILSKQIGKWVYPVHRLDKPTSGVILFALDSHTAKLISEQFQNHTIQKEYICIVRGYTDKSDEINYPLSVKLDRIADKDTSNQKEAQEAITKYETLDYVELNYPIGRYDKTRYSLVKVTPKTGRKHQIRRHMKHISHHILGDTKYGRGEHNKFIREKYDCHRLLLHALTLKIIHPYTNEPLEITASLDEKFSFMIDKLFSRSNYFYFGNSSKQR